MVRRLEEQGLYDLADAEMETALRLDPNSWEVNKEAARVRLRQKRLPEAARLYELAVSLMVSDVHAWAKLVTCYHVLGEGDAERRAAEMSVAQAEQVLAQDPSNGAAMSFGAAGHAALGQTHLANEWMERAMLVDSDNLNMRYNFACMLATHLDDKDGALRLLERYLFSIGAFQVSMAEADPGLDSIRDDPQFQVMLGRAKKRLGVA